MLSLTFQKIYNIDFILLSTSEFATVVTRTHTQYRSREPSCIPSHLFWNEEESSERARFKWRIHWRRSHRHSVCDMRACAKRTRTIFNDVVQRQKEKSPSAHNAFYSEKNPFKTRRDEHWAHTFSIARAFAAAIVVLCQCPHISAYASSSLLRSFVLLLLFNFNCIEELRKLNVSCVSARSRSFTRPYCVCVNAIWKTSEVVAATHKTRSACECFLVIGHLSESLATRLKLDEQAKCVQT